MDLLPSFFLSLENTNCQEATSFNALDFCTHDRDVVICLRASAEEIFSVSKNRRFVPWCSNRNNPGELHSSVETCITRRLHWGSPSWRRLHLGINPEDTFTGEVHSKMSFRVLFLTPSRESIQIAHRWRSCQQVW